FDVSATGSHAGEAWAVTLDPHLLRYGQQSLPCFRVQLELVGKQLRAWAHALPSEYGVRAQLDVDLLTELGGGDVRGNCELRVPELPGDSKLGQLLQLRAGPIRAKARVDYDVDTGKLRADASWHVENLSAQQGALDRAHGTLNATGTVERPRISGQ